jgi:hypothetical protein
LKADGVYSAEAPWSTDTEHLLNWLKVVATY